MSKVYSCIEINSDGVSEHFELTKRELKHLIKLNKKNGIKYERLGKGIVSYNTIGAIDFYEDED